MESKSKEKNQDIELTQSNISETHQVPFSEDNEYVVNKDTESILKDSTSGSNKKWKLEGVNIVVLSVIILSTAITIALILSIIFGQPQIIPHGAVAVDDDFCGQIGLKIMQKNKGNAVDAMVSVMLCLTVTRPDVASLGGCGAVLVRDRNKQLSYLFDFSCPVRNSAGTVQDKPDRNKPASLVGIPSLVRGLSFIHQRFGLLKWSDLFIGAIDLAKNGFIPGKSLIEAVNKINASNLSEPLKLILQQLKNEDNLFFPPVELPDTLRRLAEQRDNYFYNDDMNTFNRQLVDYMKQQGFQWSPDDLKMYSVHRPNPLKMSFAGFTLESFPAPLVGGVYILLLLGNLDLKDAISPLDHQALLRQDPAVTAVYLHRLLELSRLAEASVTTLGDLDDPTIRVAATTAQDSILSRSMREASVTSILDSGVVKEHSQLDVLQTTYEGSSIGGTGIVTTDSTSFTVVGNIFMGSPFGNGQIIPGTGVLLNSALQLFSETKLNKFAPGRRPLVPIGPVYLSTTHRKCGIRVGVASNDGLWGLTDAAQVS
ncbi:Glutathione hydrolase 7 [Schistosoma japonicum]|nr:Glutathione hydrolase 7 [Schistosoma japonicum]KAH8872749.1 Glutathione hydrolase 7 [Schistosoma japonicum]